MNSDRKLFGTDGVRGRAGSFVTAELATALGRAATLASAAARPQVLIVRDTRESGPMLESALAAGVAAAGGDALLGGVLPTPAASVLVRRHGLDLGAVVSASHNPFEDNGIKFFSMSGEKLDDAAEAEIERLLDVSSEERKVGRVRELQGSLEDYLRELSRFFELDLNGLHVVLDCANGATYRAAPAIFERLGARVEPIAVEPDGRNINAGCGSTHIENLTSAVIGSGADIGFAFDGDGDRLLAVDRNGVVHDGDDLVALAANDLQRRGALRGGVVVTLMTNYGFHQAMEKAGIDVATTKVGDRYVLEELARREWPLGGEQSGHIISMDFAPTGDGVAGGAARAAVARRPRPRGCAAVREAATGARKRRGRRSRGDQWRHRGLGGGRAREGVAGGPRTGARAPLRHRAVGPGHGRGAQRAGMRAGLQSPRCPGP